VVRFSEKSPLFDLLNISRADIPCVLENNDGGTARSIQPGTLYITINVKTPTLYNSPPNEPTADGGSPAEEGLIRGSAQSSIHEQLSPLSDQQPVEAGNNKPPSREEASPASTSGLPLALDQAGEAMNRIIPIDRANTWESALGKIKWVMDTLAPITEVSVCPFDILAKLTCSYRFPHSQRWRMVYC
jgi:hypothetical protein